MRIQRGTRRKTDDDLDRLVGKGGLRDSCETEQQYGRGESKQLRRWARLMCQT